MNGEADFSLEIAGSEQTTREAASPAQVSATPNGSSAWTNLAEAETELQRRERLRSPSLTEEQREEIRTLGTDLKQVWEAPTTTDRDRKELLATLLEEVNIQVERGIALPGDGSDGPGKLAVGTGASGSAADSPRAVRCRGDPTGASRLYGAL